MHAFKQILKVLCKVILCIQREREREHNMKSRVHRRLRCIAAPDAELLKNSLTCFAMNCMSASQSAPPASAIKFIGIRCGEEDTS